MGFIDRLLPNSQRAIRNKTIEMFEEFIQNIYWNETMSKEESEKSLEESVVEIKMYGGHSSNGLIVTNNGYFITAKHCLQVPKDSLKVYLKKEAYPIEKVCVFDNGEDLALAKIDLGNDYTPKKFKYYNTMDMNICSLSIIGVWNDKIKKTYGLFKSENNHIKEKTPDKIAVYKNHFTLQAKTIRGDSGSIIVSDDRRLMGFLHGGTIHSKGFLDLHSTGIKFLEALEMMDFYVRYLKKQQYK